MRIILLAFFLTFTWAVLAKEEKVDYKILGADKHYRYESILVLDVESDEFGREDIWILFQRGDHSSKSLELFVKNKVSYVRLIERDRRRVINSNEIEIYNESFKYIGNLHKVLPKKSMKSYFTELWNEGFTILD
jgi:hypothetical protein